MTKIKQASTRNQNKGIAEITCPITYVVNKIGGHWKPIILYYLIGGPKRYNELRRAIPAITEKMLAQHLRQLRDDNLVNRKAVQDMPPITVYSLTASGKKLGPILMAMADWAAKDNKLYKNLNMTDAT